MSLKKMKKRPVKIPIDFKPHRVVEANSKGRDYFVGDIHGRYERLMKTLRQMRFDPQKDRLFAAGDLVDRGFENMDVIGLLSEPWFFSVAGNHEELLVNAVNNADDRVAIINHVENGGDWAWEKDDTSDFGVVPTADGLRASDMIMVHCHVMMTVETPQGRIGVVHADCPRVWPEPGDIDQYRRPWLWNRSIHKDVQAYGEYSEPRQVHNIDAVVHGHCSYHEVLRNANRIWIDTASYGDFTVLPAEELLYLVRKNMALLQGIRAPINNPWM